MSNKKHTYLKEKNKNLTSIKCPPAIKNKPEIHQKRKKKNCWSNEETNSVYEENANRIQNHAVKGESV